MRGRMGFLKTTVIGGFVFLVPFIIVLAILGKAFQVMRRVAEPISAMMPIDSVGDIALVNLLAVALIVMLCFVAGLIARASLAGRMVQVLEARFLEHLPIYSFVKGMTASVAGSEGGKELAAVLARLDDYWQVAFEVERLDDGQVVVYLPGAPNPWSGAVCIMTADRIQPLDANMMTAVQNFRHLGRGSNALLSQPLKAGAAPS